MSERDNSLVNSQVPKYSLSVVLPAYNESHRLPETLRLIRVYLDRHFPVYEVIVVDDGSSDGTAEMVERQAVSWPALQVLRQPKNMGKGAAVKRGCLAAVMDLVLFMDADLATPIEEVELMLPHFGDSGYSAAVGIRTYQEDESKWRRIVGLSLQILAHLVVFEKAVIDSQCGFKCFTNAAAKELFSRTHIDGGMIDVELFFLMHRLGIPVYYQPVHWKNKPGSRINFVKCMLFDPFDLIAIRMRSAIGKYDLRRARELQNVARAHE
jgi:dolichyl-phosphate beta-glucosyltransferase